MPERTLRYILSDEPNVDSLIQDIKEIQRGLADSGSEESKTLIEP